MVSDFSGIVPEFYITGKPLLYCHSDIAYKYIEYADRMLKSCYEVYDKDMLLSYLEDLIADKDDKAQERKAFIEEYFPDIKNNTNRILDVLYTV